MSSADPGLPQEGPNPLELFFEQNKKWIYALAVLLVVALAANYGWQKLERARLNSEWRALNAATGFSKKYGESVELSPLQGQMKQYEGQMWAMTLGQKQVELVTQLMDDVGASDKTKLDKMIGECAGDKTRLPWLLWAAANRAYANGEWAECEQRCTELKTQFKDHLLTTTTDWPVQVREEKDKPKKKKDDEEEDEANKKPEYVDAVPGNPVDSLIAAANADKKFRKDNPQFFTAPEPDSAESVVFSLTGVDVTKPVDVEIAFFKSAAPKHIAAFKKAVADKYFDGLRIHKIKRKPRTSRDSTPVPATVHLGHPDSKDDDREKWKADPEDKDEDLLEFEAGQKSVSMFPLMVAAEQGKDGKSTAKRFFFCANDCAATMDGDYVVFGRVVKGGEHIVNISGRDLLDTNMENEGEGTPADEFKVEKAVIKKR